jgi:YegS/Rv2252/BmrU family lipid kinase
MMDIAVLFNSKAGRGRDIAGDELVTRIERATGRQAVLVESPDDARGAKLLVAAGGDGTVSSCATALIGTTCELGVLPLGTSNSFAAALDIPDDLDAAIENLARPERRKIDVAMVDGRAMILHCMIGLHAETIADTATDSKQRWGVLAYAATAVKKLGSLTPFAIELTTREHVVKCRAIAIAAANLAPLKTVLAHGPSHLLGDDGRVDITIVAAETIGEAIAAGVHLYRTGRAHEPAERDNIGSFSTPHVRIVTDPPQLVLVDGEEHGTTPVTIETLQQALTVIAPAAAVAEGDPIEASLLGLPDLEVSTIGS